MRDVSGIIAIVGRPNVGKSALFNRIAGRRIAIVHDQPGVTRDRVTAEAEWNGRPFTVVDTGGIGLARGEKSADVIQRAAYEQVQLAIESAHVVILVVNVQEGLAPLDNEVAERLHRSGKPVMVAANKSDNQASAEAATEFAELGFASVFPVSAIHDRGIHDLMEAALAKLPAFEPPVAPEAGAGVEAAARPLRLAIVGRPNVGKSSIINKLTQSERVVVSPVPGTTRDAVDVPFEVETDGVRQRYVLIDTAGMRKARRMDDSIEFFSVQRTVESIGRADIVVLVLDAESGILEQDKKISDKIIEARKACIVVVNKWDLVAESVRAAHLKEIERREKGESRHAPKVMTTLSDFGRWVQERLFFLDYAPVIFTSALDGFQLDRLLESVRYVGAQLRQTVPTALLNRTLQDAIERRQPISAQGHRLKFFYATQVNESPPTFLLFVNRDELFSPTYEKYLAGELRKAFGFEGCPIVLVPKPRPKHQWSGTQATIRAPAPRPAPGRDHRRGRESPARRGKAR